MSIESDTSVMPVDGCCACCADAVNRLASGIRLASDGCNCADYEDPERCDCAFCVAVTATGLVLVGMERAGVVEHCDRCGRTGAVEHECLAPAAGGLSGV